MCLQLSEQPRVLDRDDGLVSKRLDQLDLLRREGTHLLPPHGYCADRSAVAKQRDNQKRTHTARSLQRLRPRELRAGLSGKVPNMHHLPGQDGRACGVAGKYREGCSHLLGRDLPAVRNDLDDIAGDTKDECVPGVAQPGRIVGHSVQHALEIGR